MNMIERNMSNSHERNSIDLPKPEDKNPVAESAGQLVGAFDAKYLMAIDALATGISSEAAVREQLRPVFEAMAAERFTPEVQDAVKREMVKEALGPKAKPEKITETHAAIADLDDLITVPFG